MVKFSLPLVSLRRKPESGKYSNQIPAFAGMALVLTLLFFQPAHAANYSGAYLMQVCGVDEKGKELVKNGHTACQGYITGIIDYHNLLRSLGTAPSVDFCVPKGTPPATLQAHVMRYMMKHRNNHENFSAAPAVSLALYGTFPCE